jgi:PAS domain S-box-containing protein
MRDQLLPAVRCSWTLIGNGRMLRERLARPRMTVGLDSLVDALPGLIWTGFSDGRIDFLNHRWREYTGLGVEDGCGTGWHRVVHPDDVPDLLESWRSSAASRHGGEVEAEARLRRFDGVYRWFLFRTTALTGASVRVARWCGVGTDIDARRRSGISAFHRESLDRRSARALGCPALDVDHCGLHGLGAHTHVGLDPPMVAGERDAPMMVRAMNGGGNRDGVELSAEPLGEDALPGAIRGALERSHAAVAAEMQTLWDRYVTLSRREREVMALVVSGLLNKQVGGVLGISEITVKAHRGKVMRKMKADSLADLVTMGGTLGLRRKRPL